MNFLNFNAIIMVTIKLNSMTIILYVVYLVFPIIYYFIRNIFLYAIILLVSLMGDNIMIHHKP